MSGRKPPRRKLFDWCENCASRLPQDYKARDGGDAHRGHALITWTTKDRETIMGFSREG